MKRIAMATAVLLGFMAQSVLAQSEGLRRLTDRDDLLGWEGVGRLDAAQGGFCTATLIAKDLVLTAAHCVFERGRQRDAGELTFRAGLRDGFAIAEREIAAIAVPDAYRPGVGMQFDNVVQDVALLRLAQPITVAEADPFVLYQGALRGTEISVTSYGQGRAEALSRQRACQIVAEQDPLIAFDCNVTFGSSGAPVFVTNGPRKQIVSIVSGGARLNGKLVAVGMRLPGVVAGLKSDLRQQGSTSLAPQIRRLGTNERRQGSGAKFIRPGGS